MNRSVGLPVAPKGTVVLVAQFFPPLNIIGSQRAVRMAKVLLESYDCVIVITQNQDFYAPSFLDHNYESDLFDHPNLVLIEAKSILSNYGLVEKRLWHHQVVGAVLTRVLCSTGLDWIPDLNRKLASLVSQQGSNIKDLKLVVATGSPFLPFFTVTRWAKENTVKVILDYRDLWTGNPRAPYSRFFRYVTNRLIERPVNSSATAIVTVSEGCKAVIDVYSKHMNKYVLYNSPDTGYIEYYRSHVLEMKNGRNKRTRKRKIVLTGQVYKECTFAPFLKGMLTLSKEKREQIEFHYYGNNSIQAREEFCEFGLESCLNDHGRVSKSESISAILEADLLLSLIHTDSISKNPAVSGLLTTKVYDYFLSGNPILNISPVDAEINKFARMIDYNPFYTFIAEDHVGIGALLIDLLDNSGLKSQKPLSVKMPNFSDDFRRILKQIEDLKC